jgi:hypothetical protein
MVRSPIALVVLLAAMACHRAAPLRALTCPDPAWRPATTPDSAVAICLAPGYAPVRYSPVRYSPVR